MESKKTYIPEFIYKGSNQLAMIIFVPIFALLFIYSLYFFSRNSGINTSTLDTHTRSNQCTGSYNGTTLDNCIVKNDCSHSYEATILYYCSMNNGIVSYGYITADYSL